ncbi:uncharacterized protein FOMMEDRAFT_150930 [Fomitiporia mediterranea MF3/22]|uniref:uncharacterized protein n=1 Tax=Fomitiporia mediterranea (strain MF3/22) TaxID=694068 RepID=UPI0004407904|nr:uncharacterized protein FOMMEDRAFT_150930 [Fomitiporia mediterranea MF3/22]EJD08211.1 hypothetical protein FOMMEDRAFT_150930 [Fomitiporia mediterranea MF3/22]
MHLLAGVITDILSTEYGGRGYGPPGGGPGGSLAGGPNGPPSGTVMHENKDFRDGPRHSSGN